MGHGATLLPFGGPDFSEPTPIGHFFLVLRPARWDLPADVAPAGRLLQEIVQQIGVEDLEGVALVAILAQSPGPPDAAAAVVRGDGRRLRGRMRPEPAMRRKPAGQPRPVRDL